jgi:hypothetical protein
VNQGQNLVVVGGRVTSRPSGGQIMKRLTSAQLFAAPKSADNAKARLERAKLVIVAARERAVETAQQCAARPSTMRPPTVLQRRRLVGRFSGRF